MKTGTDCRFAICNLLFSRERTQKEKETFMRYFKLVGFIVCSLVALATLLPFKVLAVNLLTNGGFNNPYNNISSRVWHEQNEKIADGWDYFYIDDNTYPGSGDASKLHWMSSAQFAGAFGGLDYHIEGDQAQNMWSSYEFDAGVYQQISGLTMGQSYKFDIKMVTYWRGPGYPDTNGKMVKQVGVDPYGGTDPTSSNIIWGKTDSNDKAWVGMVAAATAEVNTMTVFAKVQAPENDSYNHTDLDMVYFEDSRLEHIGAGPTTTLNASTAGMTVNLSWSGNPASGWALKGYEVQYKDQAGGDWVTLQDKSGTNTTGDFTGQATHTYTIRARTWQTTSGLDMPGVWEETSVTIDEVVAGQVINHAGIRLSGVTVSVSGTSTSTLSAGGDYGLETGVGTFEIVANDFDNLAAPPATSVTVPSNGVGTLVITLRPTGTNQALGNNDFETDLFNWNADSVGANVSNADRHTGERSLWISNTVSISQTGAVTGMSNPLLSFWHKNDTPFTVEFLAEGVSGSPLGAAALSPVQTQTLAAVSDWTFFTLELASNTVYTGNLGVNFSYTGAGANIFVDEVSIAAGPNKIYLPIMSK
jgi:hypothetical protein